MRSSILCCVFVTLLGCPTVVPEDNNYCAADPLGVIEVDEGEPQGTCPFDRGPPCDADYLVLPDKQPGGAPEVMDDLAFEDMIFSMRGQILQKETAPLSSAALKDRVVDGAEMGWMLDGFEERELRVSIVESSDAPGARFRRWQLEDPLVGKIRGYTALPDGEGPFPAIVIAHGHTQNGQEWLDEYDGRRLADLGYAVVAPTFRINDGDQDESRVTEHLLRRGMTFAGVRVYEQLLALKYAAWMPEVDGCRIGLLGRSGGSITGALTARITLGFTAFVSDLAGEYFLQMPDGVLLDETAPKLYVLSELINDTQSNHFPILRVGYGYVTEDEQQLNAWGIIFDFLDENVMDADPGR
ncbi:MAG: dienelactone hydrolase family protein [Deltaproteobacteria bacterium]|nr:dienelactone hydrolase family protein [Deltaproteobacteria bacterium]